MFAAFDNPDTAVSCPERNETTVTPQALWFLNNKSSFRQAIKLAARLVKETGEEPAGWVERIWQLALAREPTGQERRESLDMLNSLSRKEIRTKEWPEFPLELSRIPANQAAALAKLCLAVFNLNEFAYID
jgi:hypothetical protein